MQNNWVNEQRSALAEIDSRVDELRSRMTPTVSELVYSHVATKSPFEELRSRRSWILAILLFCNVSALINLTFQVLSWPSTVELSLSDAQVQVYHDTNGKSNYVATVPVKEFPYDVQLKQGLRFDVLVFIAVNLLLVLGLTHVFWRESRLRDDHKDRNQGSDWWQWTWGETRLAARFGKRPFSELIRQPDRGGIEGNGSCGEGHGQNGRSGAR